MLAGVLFCSMAVANSDYDNASEWAHQMKGQGMDTLTGTDPSAAVPGYTGGDEASGYYHGGTASGSSDLENAGNQALQDTDTGKLVQDVIRNRPPDVISTDAPFMKTGLDVVEASDTLMQDTDTQCHDVDVSKTQLTYYTCERTPAVQLSCTRTAGVQWHEESRTERRTITVTGLDMGLPDYAHRNDNSNAATVGQWRSPVTGSVLSVTASWTWDGLFNSFAKDVFLLHMDSPFGTVDMQAKSGTVMLNAGQWLSEGQVLSFPVINRRGKTSSFYIWGSDHHTVTFTLQMEVPVTVLVPTVVWSEACPFDRSEQVRLSSVCTQAGGTRTFSRDGRDFPLYSDCWQYVDTYVSQVADSGRCGTYMNNPACTISRTTCLDAVNGNCLREQAVFSCETQTNGKAKVCGAELVCQDGECDAIEHNRVDSFKQAVSQLAALAAAGKDVSALNGVDIHAFTGEAKSCRKAAAGFSNCCKDGGWGQSAGLAQCNSEEKEIGKAKGKKLSVYVGSYCSKKVLGVCLQRKEGYCIFESKLARIIQEQGRRDQLHIGFGSGSSPKCRGLTIDELQQVRFDQINFSDFYSDLENGTTLPADDVLLDRIEQQVTSKMEER